MAVTDWCVSKSCFLQVSLACESILGRSTIVDISYVLSGYYMIDYDVTWILKVARLLLLGKSVEGCDRQNSQLVMIDSWDICTTRNVSKEGDLMTTTFSNSWIWFTCNSLMVHICDKKRRLTLYIFWYFRGVLIPIMTAATFEGNLTKKCECLHRNVR